MPQAAREFPVKGMIDTSFIDWKGCLSTVVFTGGCNFRCPYCHNRDLVENAGGLADVPLTHLEQHFRKYRKWLDRIVITGGEPTIHAGLPDFIARLREWGIRVKLDTNGSNPSMLKDLMGRGLIDFVAMDVKGPLDGYSRWSGGAPVNAADIAESIEIILAGDTDHEFRMTVVPFLHKEKDVYEVAELVGHGRRFTLQEFRPQDTLDPAYEHIRPFSPEKMDHLRKAVAAMRSLKNRLQA